jgi:hypothetical protein
MLSQVLMIEYLRSNGRNTTAIWDERGGGVVANVTVDGQVRQQRVYNCVCAEVCLYVCNVCDVMCICSAERRGSMHARAYVCMHVCIYVCMYSCTAQAWSYPLRSITVQMQIIRNSHTKENMKNKISP